MKLGPRDAPGYFARPDPTRPGILIYGGDSMRVALRRQEIIAALLGPTGEEEMRLTRLSGADLRSDAALLVDATREIGFFPGQRVAFVEEATDTIAPAAAAALADWRKGDAVIVITAGALKKTSALRKLFESHPQAYAIGIYDDPPSRAEVEAMLAKSGIASVDPGGMGALTALAASLDPGDFRQVVEKLGLYTLGQSEPASAEDVAAVAPLSVEAGIDEVLAVVTDMRSDKIGPLIRRVEAQGITAVGLCIAASRHFRQLYTVAADPGGPGQGVGRLRPPVFGARREQITRAAGNWGLGSLEKALLHLTETDLRLRSSSHAPDMAVMERCLLRLAALGRRR